ncbi:DUF4342 domain-containing protein [uncultured Clostridium sp.]|uniref:DUF4342 domain-containing protein n=1 Tax=uncultured Clostridium sp. TaxID=59620 RepID=UPI0026181B4A|nr:DUF4342 domain-containing protein [uncultured Clostridium sp.]
MEKITLEKVDQILERTCVTYKEAKAALEIANGDVLSAIINIEESQQGEYLEHCEKEKESKCKKEETVDEFKGFIMNLVNKGTVSRIKIKKDDSVLADVPVNTGIAAGVIAILLPPVLVVAAVAVVGAKLTIEITKTDGSVEIVNKIVKSTASDLKDKSKNVAGIATAFMKLKAQDLRSKHDSEEKISVIDTIKSMKTTKIKDLDNSSNFSYTVNFEDVN